MKVFHLVVLGLICFAETNGHIKITKLECNATDPDFARLDWCILKPESRDVQYVKIRYTVLQLPITNFELRVQILQRLNGWKPFLYDVTVNCSTVRRLNKLTGFAWTLVKNVTNIQNKNCPITQNLYEIERLDNKFLEDALRVLPVPPGVYAAIITASADQKLHAAGNLVVTIS